VRDHELDGARSKEWDAEAALEGLVSETIDVHGGDTVKHAEMILHDAAAVAATNIVHTAKYSPNEKQRMDASKYIIERVMGRVGDSKNAGENPLEELLREAVKSVEMTTEEPEGE
jgi:hypothetical protein